MLSGKQSPKIQGYRICERTPMPAIWDSRGQASSSSSVCLKSSRQSCNHVIIDIHAMPKTPQAMIKNKCENEMTCNYKQQKNNNRNTSPCVLTASPRGTQDNNILWDPKKLQAAKKKLKIRVLSPRVSTSSMMRQRVQQKGPGATMKAAGTTNRRQRRINTITASHKKNQKDVPAEQDDRERLGSSPKPASAVLNWQSMIPNCKSPPRRINGHVPDPTRSRLRQSQGTE